VHLAYTRFDPKDQNAGYDVAMARCPLVIGHGLFGSRGNWSGLARKFSLSRRVFVVDHRNHGDSPHCLSHTYQEMAMLNARQNPLTREVDAPTLPSRFPALPLTR
jgi:pimeloyl-ACP methyl ester carboxylesterase